MSGGVPVIGGLVRLSQLLAGQSKTAVDIQGGTIVNTPITLQAATLAATGTDQSTAAAIATQVVNVTGADGTVAVRLPAATAGAVYVVYNSVATNGLPVFPATSGTINGGSANAAVTIEGKTLAVFVGSDSTNWGAIYTANT